MCVWWNWSSLVHVRLKNQKVNSPDGLDSYLESHLPTLNGNADQWICLAKWLSIERAMRDCRCPHHWKSPSKWLADSYDWYWSWDWENLTFHRRFPSDGCWNSGSLYLFFYILKRGLAAWCSRMSHVPHATVAVLWLAHPCRSRVTLFTQQST